MDVETLAPKAKARSKRDSRKNSAYAVIARTIVAMRKAGISDDEILARFDAVANATPIPAEEANRG